MVEASTKKSKKQSAAVAEKVEEKTPSTPESEKPRVQLELKSKAASGSPGVAMLDQSNGKEQHLDLLKQTVAHLENHDGGEQRDASGQTAANALENSNTDTIDAEQRSRENTSRFEAQQQELLSKVAELQNGTGPAASMSFEERADSLNELFVDKLLPLLKQINATTIDAQVEEQLYYQQTLEFQNRGAKADIIRQKYEQITREYSTQNKQFQERHTEIKEAEQAKRHEILKNFDDHLSSIKAQMAEDVAQSRTENELIQKETADLEGKYEDLKKECAEKQELMTSQISEQDNKQGTIEDTLSTQINNQAEEIKKQVEAYKEQTKVKQEEEKQLLTVLKEYKAKYQEFQQATKSSKQNHKKFAKEVQNLGKRQKQLEVEYGALTTELDIHGEPDTVSDRIEAKVAQIAAIEQAWEAEKEQMLADVESVKAECAVLQEQVKKTKEDAAAAAK